jgi:hypothetical protein
LRAVDVCRSRVRKLEVLKIGKYWIIEFDTSREKGQHGRYPRATKFHFEFLDSREVDLHTATNGVVEGLTKTLEPWSVLAIHGKKGLTKLGSTNHAPHSSFTPPSSARISHPGEWDREDELITL